MSLKSSPEVEPVDSDKLASAEQTASHKQGFRDRIQIKKLPLCAHRAAQRGFKARYMILKSSLVP